MKNKTETKIISWNVNGIRARLDAVRALAEAERPDILCLQEIKAKDSRPYLDAIPGYVGIVNTDKEHPGYDKNNGFLLPTELYVPNPEGLIFLPALKGFAGAGGNTTADKMSEIGSTMFLKNSGRF